jgi:heme exporter protein A
VAENAAFWRRFLGGMQSAGREDGALDTLGLAALREIPAGYLSAGQKRRLGLARLLLAKRPLWLLDEPAASLDAGGQRVLAEMVDRHLAGGGLAVCTTHAPLGFASSRELRLGGTAALAA